ncbi:hypothetical protein HWV62_41408 [Athelia sp. TMB]|nr:hypothetical protein HWV62_41408 [Athelia sp. TMB]
MAENLQAAVKSLLGSSEDVTIALQTLQVLDNARRGFEQDRVLALVKHRNWERGIDEGSVFILKYQPDDTLEVSRAYPIVGSFLLSTAQSPKSYDQDAHIVPDPSQAPAPAEFTLTIQPASLDDARLRVFLGEAKRYKEKASHSISKGPDYEWLSKYVVKRAPESLLCTTAPPDLRTLIEPLHARLSAPPAGEPVNDLANVKLVREDWVRSRAVAEQEVKGRIDVRIRVGTFNVNGKMPSQDLAPWILGPQIFSPQPEKNPRPSLLRRSEADEMLHECDAGFLPPLRRLSSFSIDDINPNSNKSNPMEQKLDPEKEATPDILVLGFQEVDLSTEALLYSTSTLREDAWCNGVLAGLGAVRGDYVKLASKQLVGMLVLLIVKMSIVPYIGEIKLTTAGSGIMGMMGNKGGTALRFTITPPLAVPVDASTVSESRSGPRARPTTLTFVNAHLAAFDEYVDRRNADYHDLGRRLRFDSGSRDGSSDTDTAVPTGIWESDIVIWMVSPPF